MSESLNVIALISGGKDSFFSILHSLQHSHRVVALANLHPGAGAALEVLHPSTSAREVRPAPDDADLNSFMYQTVGHGVIPLYAPATGLPVYRRGITGGAAQSGREYDGAAAASVDETESMTELLRGVMERHPEANAVCAGAILSTYQRTRVESVAVRLGLVPLAYLWKYPSLPAPGDDAQLLRDMAAAGLDARIIKVASAGLDEGLLWERISSETGIARARKGLRFFGGGEGAVLGEGGEFETVVVDGPRTLFKGRIVVGEGDREVVREGGGCSWLSFRGAKVEVKSGDEGECERQIRIPDLLDPTFASILEAVKEGSSGGREEDSATGGDLSRLRRKFSSQQNDPDVNGEMHWGCIADISSLGTTIEDEAKSVMDQIAAHIHPHPPTCITNTLVLLRRMADFPAVNEVYSSLFPFPNPPSRVTISCGDLLPGGHNIAVYVTLRPGLVAEERKGLHVQSRSYWAPANIGPYSQAIDVPLVPSPCSTADSSSAHRPRCVAIAGQIPLIPSTMNLPTPPSGALQLSIALSLQHLWRIAAEMKVQLWTSAVAYFPRAPSPDEMAHRASLAGTVWSRAHSRSSDEEDEEAAGPDLWDRRFNPEYMTVGDDATAKSVSLPDWEVFEDEDSPGCKPPVFAVEVEELPRGAEVEWHAHAGLSAVNSGAVQTGVYSGVSRIGKDNVRWRSYLVTVDCGHRTFVHNTLSIERDDDSAVMGGAGLLDSALNGVWKDSMLAAGVEENILDGAKTSGPYLVYGALTAGHTGHQSRGPDSSGVPYIPCRSIWASNNRRVDVLALFKCML